MGLRLQRCLGGPADLEPGQFCTDPGHHVARTMIATWVRCVECGGTEPLDDRYTIAKDGRVTPRFECQTPTCGWSEWLELDTWGEPVFDTSDVKP